MINDVFQLYHFHFLILHRRCSTKGRGLWSAPFPVSDTAIVGVDQQGFRTLDFPKADRTAQWSLRGYL